MNSLVICSVFMFWVLTVVSSEHKKTAHMEDALEQTKKFVDQYKPEGVVVVFDIDNTLLASKQPLGSDQWFGWQEELLVKGPKSDGLAVPNFSGLLDAWGLLLMLGKMETPEKKTASVVKSIQALKPNVFALTSRGPEYVFQTLREFKRNDLDLSRSGIGPSEGYPGVWKAYDPATVASEYSFTPQEMDSFGLTKSGRNVTYTNGIFFSSGMNKGAMLRLILGKSRTFPKALIFVDDKERHTQRVQEAFKNSKINTVTFHYTAEDTKVEAFNKSDKSEVKEQWKKLQETLDQVFKN